MFNLTIKPKATLRKPVSQPPAHLKLSLLENAYSFLNESLRHYRKAVRNIHEWPFALLHITQALELLLKQVLSQIHPILIYEDVDRPRRTVSLEQALSRLDSIGMPLEEKEKLNIRKAADFRNRVVHHEVDLNRFEWKNVYAQLFEFIHFFHAKHLRGDVHPKVSKHNWPIEARLMLYFKNNFVLYNGVEMHKTNPQEIVKAQRVPSFSDGYQAYPRFKWGDEPFWHAEVFPEIPCHDCLVLKGQYHTEGCDVEICPRCFDQLLTCECWEPSD